MVKTNVIFAVGLLIATATTAANADLIVPGTKRVSYEFVANVTGDLAGQVLFSYPCGGSDGAPMQHVTPLDSGRHVAVGNHESCTLYIAPKDVYDAWAKDAGGGMDTPAQGLLAKATQCTGSGPTPVHGLAEKDPRPGISQTIDVAVSKGACVMTAKAIPEGPAAVPSSAPAPSTEKKGGCNTSGASPLPLALALPALALLLKKKRRG